MFRLADELWICELMKQLNFVPSTSEARRLIGQGAVRVDGEPVTDANFRFVPGRNHLLEVGKRRIAQDRALAAHHQSNAGNGDQGNFK